MEKRCGSLEGHILELYHRVPCNPWERFLIRQRLRFSSYGSIASHVPFSGRILDLGSGFGILAVYLALSSAKREMTGIDISSRRVKMAGAAASHIPNVVFENADMTEIAPANWDCILLIDALHYFPSSVQNHILSGCYHQLNPGGVVLVRESNRDRTFRHLITRLHETVMTKSGFTKGEVLQFRRFSELKRFLENSGFKVRMIPMWGKTPFADTLLVCRKMDREAIFSGGKSHGNQTG